MVDIIICYFEMKYIIFHLNILYINIYIFHIIIETKKREENAL